MILKTKTKEVEITLEYKETLVGVKIKIDGHGDLSHHLIEELCDLINRLARMERVNHEVKL